MKNKNGLRQPTLRSIVVVSSLLTLGSVGILQAPGAWAAPAAPDPTLSLYVTTMSNNDLCQFAQQTASDQRTGSIAPDAFVVLHFFSAMKFSNGDFGATRSNGDDATTAEVRTSAQKYGSCWYNGNPGAGSTLKIAMGVTNDLMTTTWAYNHGRAWANMVNNANDWAVTNGYNSKLSFNGGLDAEHVLNSSAAPGKDWADGYRSAVDPWNYFFYGDAGGCPSDKYPSWTCDYNQDDILYMAWKLGVTTGFPQIYDEEPASASPPTSVNAQQWQKLSERAYNNGDGRINFSGGLSQKAGCTFLGHPSSCSGRELGPKDSWKDLWNEVNCTYDQGTCTTSDDLRWTSQITWDQTP